MTKLPWLYRAVCGVLFLPCLWGTMTVWHLMAPSQMFGEVPKMTEKTTKHQEHHHPPPAPSQERWEGSPEGMAYSEFNHALAGFCVLLIGMSELRAAAGWQIMPWMRWLVPVSLCGMGMFLLVWSDHDAWPIGSLTLAETLSGKDPEVLQHKILGILALGVGIVESCRQAGKLDHRLWNAFLPVLALTGGLLLFIHMHGHHPTGHHIQHHHNLMGTLAVAGGVFWFAGEYPQRSPNPRASFAHFPRFLKVLWALAVIIIAIQLLGYHETA